MKLNKRLSAFLLAILLVALCGCAPAEPQTPSVDSDFAVHFIDVGQADAALVVCDGKAMLIDGGNSEDSSLIYSYLNKQGITHLDYMVATHPHEDHIGGLLGALNLATVDTVYSPFKEYDTKLFENFVKYLDRQGVEITVAEAGDTFALGSAKCKILAVDPEASDVNDTSIVLRIEYGKTSFLFTGDAERSVETALVNSNYALGSTVLKVGHHGSASSTGYVFLREVMPQYAVISVGAGNDYGHPTSEVLSRLRDADVRVLRTDRHGTVVCTSDGNTVTFQTEKNADEVLGTIGEGAVTTDNRENYVANTNSMKFHLPDCSSAAKISEQNRQEFFCTRDDMIEKGYAPCGICKP